MRYTNRGLRHLDRALDAAPRNFTVRLIRAKVNSSLPKMFSRSDAALEDMLALDEIFHEEPLAGLARWMVEIYEELQSRAPGRRPVGRTSRSGPRALRGAVRTMSIISLRSVSKSYPSADTRLRVLHEIDLDIEAGEFVVVAGPSGSGKSTLLNLMGALDHPDSGTVQLDGVDLRPS